MSWISLFSTIVPVASNGFGWCGGQGSCTYFWPETGWTANWTTPYIVVVRFSDLILWTCPQLWICKAYHNVSMARIVWDILNICQLMPDLTYGIRYHRFTQSAWIDDITGFWTWWYVGFLSGYKHTWVGIISQNVRRFYKILGCGLNICLILIQKIKHGQSWTPRVQAENS